ncbi:MAG: hypothetical protein JWM16_2376 [Verrucomicrobiales bacterium]|nr:hypothetical protein [Verrucomicrobiales bacterium]
MVSAARSAEKRGGKALGSMLRAVRQTPLTAMLSPVLSPDTMKHTFVQRSLIAAALPLLIQTAFSASWQNIDDYQLVLGKNAFARGLAQDPLGNLFAAGAGVDSAGTYHGLVMKSSNHGDTWAAADDFANPTTTINLGPDHGAGICADSAGRLYAAGSDFLASNQKNWYVRRSLDGGATWATVDSFTLGGTEAYPRSLETDLAGNVYVTGTASTSGTSLTNFAIVRKGITDAAGVMTWRTVDQVSGTFRLDITGLGNLPLIYGNGLLTCHPSAGVFIAGRRIVVDKTGSYVNQWAVRRSVDGGLTWANVDAYQLDPSQDATAVGMGRDSFGNLYAVGAAEIRSKGKNLTHWIVRKSSNGGATWTTVDDYLPASGNSAAYRFAADPAGNLFVTGAGDITRKSAGGVGPWATIATAPPGPAFYPSSLMSDAAAGVFSMGYYNDAAGSRHWIIRKLIP